MEIAKVQVSGSQCTPVSAETIPKGIVGATVSIEYTDSAWDGLQKTVVFRSYVTKDVLNAGTEVVIPADVVNRAGVQLYMGVYGVGADGSVVIPTVWASLGMVRGSATPSGDSSTAPYLPVWAQLQGMIGNLDDLDTEAKESLVAAINEALTTGGGSVSPEAVQKIVDDYLKANPPASGKDGKDGVTPDIQIGTVTTLPAGSDATASMGGTTAAPLLNLGIPKGDTGTGASAFYVTVTPGTGMLCTADHTAQEVYEAYQSGRPVYARYTPSNDPIPYIIPLTVAISASSTYSLGFSTCGATDDTARPKYPCVAYMNGLWLAFVGTLAREYDIPEKLPCPLKLTIKVGGAITEYDGSSLQTVEIPTASGGGDEWELIKEITIPEGAEESNALTINQDESGAAFRLKKASLFCSFPQYTGEATPPTYSFFMLNGGTSGANRPYSYTSGLTVPAKNMLRFGSIDVDLTLSGFQRERVSRSYSVTGIDYFGVSLISAVTSIGGTNMLLYPGCQFWLYGVRE